MAVLWCRNPASNLCSLIDSCSLTDSHSLTHSPIHQTNRTHSSSLLLVLHLLILFPFIPSLLHQLPQPRFLLSLISLHTQLMKESWEACQMSLELMLYDTFISMLVSSFPSFFLSFLSPSFVVFFSHFLLSLCCFLSIYFFHLPVFVLTCFLFNLPSFASLLFYFLSLSLLPAPTSLPWPSFSSLSHLLTTAAPTTINNST